MKLSIKTLTLIFALVWPLGASAQSTDGPRLSGELLQTVETIVGGQISAFKARDHEKAFSYAAPSIQQIFGSTDRFIRMVKNGYGAIYGAQQWSFGRGEAQGDKLIQEVLITGPAGKNWVALYTLKQQSDGSWRISGVTMKAAELQST